MTVSVVFRVTCADDFQPVYVTVHVGSADECLEYDVAGLGVIPKRRGERDEFRQCDVDNFFHDSLLVPVWLILCVPSRDSGLAPSSSVRDRPYAEPHQRIAKKFLRIQFVFLQVAHRRVSRNPT